MDDGASQDVLRTSPISGSSLRAECRSARGSPLRLRAALAIEHVELRFPRPVALFFEYPHRETVTQCLRASRRGELNAGFRELISEFAVRPGIDDLVSVVLQAHLDP